MDLAQSQKSYQIVNFSVVSLLFLGLLYVFVCNEANVNYLILPTPFQKPQFLASSSKSHAATVSTQTLPSLLNLHQEVEPESLTSREL